MSVCLSMGRHLGDHPGILLITLGQYNSNHSITYNVEETQSNRIDVIKCLLVDLLRRHQITQAGFSSGSSASKRHQRVLTSPVKTSQVYNARMQVFIHRPLNCPSPKDISLTAEGYNTGSKLPLISLCPYQETCNFVRWTR